MAAQPRHFHPLLAFLDPLFGRTALVAELHHRPARQRQVSHNESDPRKQLPKVELHPRHDPPRPAIQLRWPAGVLGELADFLFFVAVLGGPRCAWCSLVRMAGILLRYLTARQEKSQLAPLVCRMPPMPFGR